MDSLSKALRDDAERIEVGVSPDLEMRICASLERVQPTRKGAPSLRASPANIGWASALTGVAIAATVILVVNLNRAPPPADVLPPPESRSLALPLLNAETAVFTAPLAEELENLEADLRKAERAVRREIGLGL